MRTNNALVVERAEESPKKSLRPYQIRMIEEMLRTPRVNLYADMGCGKTVSVLTVLNTLKREHPEDLPALIVAPLRVARHVWPDEPAEWPGLLDGFRIVTVLGTESQKAKALQSIKTSPADACAINYESLPWLEMAWKRYFSDWPFPTIVCDESTRLKGLRADTRTVSLKNGTQKVQARVGGTRRARALARITHGKTRRWINVSGTPAPNGLQDLYGPQWMLDNGAALGKSYSAYMNEFFDLPTFGQGRPVLKAKAEETILKRVEPNTILVRARDCFDLDEPVCIPVQVTLPPAVEEAYKTMERDLVAELDTLQSSEDKPITVIATNSAVATMKCLQIASGAVYSDEERKRFEIVHNEKIEALSSIVEETNGVPLLVSYTFKHERERILKEFRQARDILEGGNIIAEWNAGKVPILLAHPKSAGHGLNLAKGGNIIVFFSQWWSLEEHQQIIERIGPVRQKQLGLGRPTMIYRIEAKGTIDEQVQEALSSKSSIQQAMRDLLKKLKEKISQPKT